VIAPKGVKGARLMSSDRVRKMIDLVAGPAANLRSLSLLLFYLYFIIIPIIYITMGEGIMLYSVILFALILPIFISIWFCKLHKRFAKNDRLERWKHILSALFMPWHAMRLSDHLFSNDLFRKIHPLSMVGIANGRDAHQFIGQQYRNAIYLKHSDYTLEELERYMSLNNIAVEELRDLSDHTVNEGEGPKYCPCCHTFFSKEANECAECEGVTLLER